MEKKNVNNPNNYLDMNQPYESPEIANAAIREFYDKLSELRKEYKISDILVIIKDSIRYDDGEVGQFMQYSQFGNQLNGESMAAFAYGQLQAEKREFLNKLMEGEIKDK
jgi:hypothetical protein